MTELADDAIVILEGARTPIGSFLGGLSRLTATQLGTIAATGALERSGVDAGAVDRVVMGNVLHSAKDGAYLARHVGLGCGAPVGTPAVAVNLACGSGIESLAMAARALRCDEATVVLAGGSENMSMTPYAMRGVREGWKMVKSDVDDMLFTALHDPKAGCSIGETVEHLAEVEGIERAAADEAAAWGQQQTAAAQQAGRLAEEIVPVTIPSRRRDKLVEHDECPRPETTIEALGALPGLYKKDGVVTAGNSCGLNDAAAMAVVTSGGYAKAHGLSPLGRLVSWATVGVEPKLMGLGPVEASKRALDRAGLSLADVDCVEINDSFAVQYVAVERKLELDRAKVNRNGGAVALGHPMGATGTRLVLGALRELKRSDGRYGLCTVCVGGGQGIAAVVERI